MTNTSEDRKSRRDMLILRWRAIAICIAVVLAAVVLALNLFADSKAEITVRRKTNAVLADCFEDAFAEKEAPATGERVYPANSGNAFQFVFSAQAQNQADNSAYRNDLIFVVPVTGFSGPSVSVFYYTQESGAQFLGNCRTRGASVSESGEGDAEISAGNLRKWISKIESVALGIVAAEAQHEAYSGQNLYAGDGTEW